MEFEEILRRRRMVRRFTNEPVTHEHVNRLVHAALRSPSAGFSQGYHFLVLHSAEDRARYWGLADSDDADPERREKERHMEEAPLVILPFCSERVYRQRYSEPDKTFAQLAEVEWPVPYWYVDAAFASMLVLLEAVELGLGAVFIGNTSEMIPRLLREFGVPGDFYPLGAILVGHRHPAVGANARADRRKADDQVVSYGQWGGQL